MKYLSHRLSAAMWSRVLLLFITLAIGAVVVGGIAFGLGRFIQDNIRNELTAQQISFSPEDRLSDEERQIPGIVENAGPDTNWHAGEPAARRVTPRIELS